MEKERHLKFDSRRDNERVVTIIPDLFAPFPEIRSGMSTRLDGDPASADHRGRTSGPPRGNSDIDREHRLLLSRLQIDVRQLALPHQCHSHEVRKVESPGIYESCDSLITNEKNVALAIRVADCVPLLLFDPEKKAIAAVHAGWRGTSEKIARDTVHSMHSEFGSDPDGILCFIGPAAGVCCYEVKDDAAAFFDESVLERRKGKIFLDLKEENKRQLLQCGLRQENIEVNEYCTISERALFYSYRRDGKGTGRMLVVICRKS